MAAHCPRVSSSARDHRQRKDGFNVRKFFYRGTTVLVADESCEYCGLRLRIKILTRSCETDFSAIRSLFRSNRKTLLRLPRNSPQAAVGRRLNEILNWSRDSLDCTLLREIPTDCISGE